MLLAINSAVLAADGLNPTMANIGRVVDKSYPLLFSTGHLGSADKQKIIKDIHELKSLFGDAEKYLKNRSDAYQLTLGILQGVLENAELAYYRREYELARSRLRVAAGLCSACHTQDERLRTLYKGQGRGAFDSDLSYAEFNFATRNYALAEEYYDRHLRSLTKAKYLELVQPLQRLVTIYAQVNRSPESGAQRMQEYLTLVSHNPAAKSYLDGVIQGLKELANRDRIDIAQLDFFHLNALVLEVLGGYMQPSPIMHSTPREEVERVWLRGLLYRYLNEKAQLAQIPAVLYWLAVSDRAIGYYDAFTLTDFYLKACVRRFPDQPFALKCYQEYEKYLETFYLSPTELIFPREVDEELSELRSYLPKAP